MKTTDEDVENQSDDFRQGFGYLQMKAFPQAIECFTRHIQRYPNYVPSYNNIGVAKIELSRINEDIKLLEEALLDLSTGVALSPSIERDITKDAVYLNMMWAREELAKWYAKPHISFDQLDPERLRNLEYILNISIEQMKLVRPSLIEFPFANPKYYHISFAHNAPRDILAEIVGLNKLNTRIISKLDLQNGNQTNFFG